MPSEIHAGAALAGFRVGALIGQGAMGAVYLADDVKAGRPVALKVLTPALSEDERFRQRFLREAELAASLGSPPARDVPAALALALREARSPLLNIQVLHGAAPAADGYAIASVKAVSNGGVTIATRCCAAMRSH